MLGAIIGDIVGSRFERNNIKTKDFGLFASACHPTDDTVMSLAIAQALLDSRPGYEKLEQNAVKNMQRLGRQYRHVGYGGMFWRWLDSDKPQPYDSYGNGSAMRVGACGFAARSLEEALALSDAVTRPTHGHPEGMKGARATAAAIYLARSGKTLPEIRQHIEKHYYPLDFTLDSIRDAYTFDVTCQGSVPQALVAFLESSSFEDAIRCAISIGGDSDTIAAITGSIAQAYWGIDDWIRQRALAYLDDTQRNILLAFEAAYPSTP